MVTMIRSDLDFILAQIKIAEADAAGIDLVASGLIPNPELPWGLRRVDGSNNNLTPGQYGYGAADQPFPRATDPSYTTGTGGQAFGPPVLVAGVPPPGFEGNAALGIPPGYQAGVNWLANNTYALPTPNTNPDPRAIQPGDVADATPRVVSNLLVDQTLNNPAMVYKSLVDAGAADPFAAMATIATQVAAVKAAQVALAAAVSVSAGPGAAVVTAYTSFAAVSDSLVSLAAVVDVATSNLVATPDAATLSSAQSSIVDLLTALNTIKTAMNAPGVTEPAADLAAVQTMIDTVTLAQFQLTGIDPTDGMTGIEALLASFAETIGNGLGASATALDGQLDGTLNGLDGDVAAATATLATAVDTLRGSISPFDATTNPTGLSPDGLAIDNTPGNVNILKETLFGRNVAPDEGLSAPFNGWMTLFGQFFDHGLDLVGKGGFGTVYIPLQPDDPLYVPGSPTNFMAVTRATLGPDGQPVNKVTPFVDQNQTYTSNASAQVFHREYEMRPDAVLGYDVPYATGRLLSGQHGGLATWAEVKAQALNLLGIALDDYDIHNIPQLMVDDYGNFIRGSNGFAQIVTSNSPVTVIEGSPTNPADASLAVKTGHAFLDDIAHNANPGQFDNVPGPGLNLVNEDADADTDISTQPGTQPAGTYDNELLDAHFITGDGRGNENIGLTTVHHVFHSEHNRQLELIKELVLTEAQDAETTARLAETAAAASPTDTLLADKAALARAEATEKLGFLNEWTALDLTATTVATQTLTSVVWDGERLFQGAKFPTEMQYQHLVFEEFARKVQPFVNVFNDYDGTLDPAIMAEFAHTVYRFGHSMLDETVDRFDTNFATVGTGGAIGGEQIGLIEAFLNPVEYTNSGIDSEAAAGAIVRGMTRQYGNEIDEFVTEALRNNLVGLPLDLAAINIARGRETGVPSLNDARANFFAGTNDSQLKPYESWADFAQNLKNPASLINFIAAYGTHTDITSATSVEAKRDAATAIVLGGPDAPADRLDFLNATGAWVKANSASLGGLNFVDFWIGGLAEKKMVFGGMLGSTFNFVFETQMEALQDGDRFYYLSRLANLNLTAQLENNKFAELIHRNTDATHLPGDVFARPDFFLEVDQTKQFNTDLGTLDPTSDNPFFSGFNPLVIRDAATNKLQFTGAEHVVLGGTNVNDILIGGLGDDALWGDDGNDRQEGGEGNDFFFGGDGADTITDKFGDDEVRSGGGDDVVSAGQGFNLIITDTGNDFVWAGGDLDEVLLGQGDDFGAGGAGEDMIIGGEGNDWIETGTENGLFLGDNGDLVQGLPVKRSVDSPIVGNDILIATGGNADFDAETGDDIMVGGLGTDRFFGAFGFDWASYKNDPIGIEADMNVRQFAPPTIAASPGAILDRYAQTEGLSGSSKTDFLRGDDAVDLRVGLPGTVTSLGLASQGLDNALKDASLDLIEGLRAFLSPSAAPGTDAGEAGVNAFSSGNILLGGKGGDVIEGRGGNDVVDGDRWLNVVIRVTPPNGDTPYEVQGMADIQAKLFSGELSVADLTMVRRIEGSDADDAAIAVDIAQFSGRRADYLVEGLNDPVTGNATGAGFASDTDGDGFVSVRHITRDPVTGQINFGGPDPADDNIGGLDGTDRLKNVERLFFSDQTIKVNDHINTIATGAINVTGNALTGALTASLTGAASGSVADVNGFNAANVTYIWQSETTPGSGIWTNINRITADEFSPVTGPTFTPTAAEAGQSLRVLARFLDNSGAVEHVTSDPLNGVSAVNARPVFDEVNAILGPDLGGTVVDGVNLPANSFGILEGTATFTFSLNDVWVNRFNGQPLATDPNDLINDTVTVATPNVMSVRERDGTGTVGTVVEANPLDPWTLADGSPNLTKQFVFTPAPNFEGTAVFEFDITDGVTESTPAEATLDVFNVNDAPVAATNTGNLAVVTAGTTFTFTEAMLIGNATDIDGDQVRLFRSPDPTLIGADQFVELADPTQGTIVLNADGSFTFTASATAFGPVSFQYSITDTVATVATSATFTMGRTFNGTGADEVVTGTIAGDILDGAGGVDVLNGGDGDDVLQGGNGGPDSLNGQAGDDTIIYTVGNGGGANRDIVDGGLGGTDTYVVNGNNGVETFRVYAAADWLLLGGTRALLSANSDIVITRGGTGNGAVIAELDEIEEIVINTGDGNDTVLAIGDFLPTNLSFNTIEVNNEGGADRFDVSGLTSEHRGVLNSTGTDASGVFVGQRTQDVLHDDEADLPEEETEDEDEGDTSNGSGSGSGTTGPLPSVVFAGTSADDAVVGGAGNDDLVGADGSDTIIAKDGDDNIVAGKGDDEVFAGAGNDLVSAGDGKDFVFGDAGDDVILGGAGDDRADGGSGNDQIWGGDGSDVVMGGAGNDVIFAMSGDANDIINGGDGIDTLNYEAATTNTVFDLAKGSANGTDTGLDAIANIENVIGGRGRDTFYANDEDNVFNGGGGNDSFVFRTAAAADGDTIEGFHAGDKIALKDIFGGTAPTIVEGAFTAAGQIRLTYEADGDTLLEGNTGGDANEDFAILVKAYQLKTGDLT